MDKIENLADLVAYLKERWADLAAVRDEYEASHPQGAETIEDKITEGEMDGAEGEIAALLYKVGMNPYPGEKS